MDIKHIRAQSITDRLVSNTSNTILPQINERKSALGNYSTRDNAIGPVKAMGRADSSMLNIALPSKPEDY